MDGNLPVTCELVPATSFFDNLRKGISRAEWDRIRRRTYAKYGHRCGTCEATGRR